MLFVLSLLLAAAVAEPDAAAPGDVPRPPPPGVEAGPERANTPPWMVRVEPEEGGGFAAYRGSDATPIRGVDFYRLVLRLDLVEAHDRTAATRWYLIVSGLVLIAAGPAIGYVAGEAAGTPTDNCVRVPSPPNCGFPESVVRENRQRRARGIAIGAAAGIAVGVPLLVLGTSLEPHVPTLEEARELAERWNQGHGPAPSSAPAIHTGSLRLAPAPGGAKLALGLRF